MGMNNPPPPNDYGGCGANGGANGGAGAAPRQFAGELERSCERARARRLRLDATRRAPKHLRAFTYLLIVPLLLLPIPVLLHQYW